MMLWRHLVHAVVPMSVCCLVPPRQKQNFSVRPPEGTTSAAITYGSGVLLYNACTAKRTRGRGISGGSCFNSVLELLSLHIRQCHCPCFNNYCHRVFDGDSLRFCTYLSSPPNHIYTVRLFGNQECPKISMTSNPRQNCRIGQLTTKKWFFSPDQFGLRRKRKGKSGEIRSLLETLGSTL